MEFENTQPQEQAQNLMLQIMRKAKGTKLKMKIYLMKLTILMLLTL